MHAIRQKCRPKHQVLVLNCYPRGHKNNVEVKPNSSELSYLLYYASTRRSKLQKVGDFLDTRTTSDVWKARIGNVQVTLQIVKALIEKTHRDLSLYAYAVMRIFRTILRSNDLTMIEETVSTFETFCRHQDAAQLAADQDFIQQYNEIVNLYASFASKDTPVQNKTAKTIPTLIRFRKAGLEAIKAITSTDILTAETASQLHAVVPILLENVYSDNGHLINVLSKGEEEKTEMEKEIALKRRQSTSTVRTAETIEGDAAAAAGTTEAADKLAEQEAGVIALQALKSIFTQAPRTQLRLVTMEVLRWIGGRVHPKDHFPSTEKSTLIAGSWPCTLFSYISSWSPVQDRYVILVTLMDTLVRSPIIEEDLERQYVFAVIIGWLLSSDINFIGLSIMDVLVGLVQHTLLLLQLGGAGTNIQPHPQQVDGISASMSQQPSPTSAAVVMEITRSPSAARIQLLTQLQRDMGCLAVHIYYSDQISDMVAAILSRLKPSIASQTPDTASAIDNPIETANAIASSVNLSEKPGVDGFFSFETARVSALQAVGEIITWANLTKSDGSPNSISRTALDVDRWEGTQWLLRDPSWKCRAAYVDALLSWTKYELKKKDLRVPDEHVPKKMNSQKRENGNKDSSLARRAVSNASQRELSPKRKRNTFLQLLHLAVYDSAHQYAESESDMLLLHLLLTNLVMKLGVNAAQHGLPMIVRLQEDIPNIDSPLAKINIGGLVHGYFWALSVHFNFDGASTGRDIHNEISRRLNHSIWLNSIRVPPMSVEQIDQRRNSYQKPPSDAIVATETLKPYDKRAIMVDKIAEGYTVTLYSPPASPPTSPNRGFSQPILGQVTRAASFSAPRPQKNNNMPNRTKEALLTDWTREAIIAATVRSDGSRSGSMHGSASPTTNTGAARHLSVGVGGANGSIGSADAMISPRRASHLHGSRPASGTFGFAPQGYVAGSAMREALNRPHSRRSRRTSQTPTPYSTSSVHSTVRVDDLKKVLGGTILPQAITTRGEDEKELDVEDGNETSSESMVSYDGSDISYAPAANKAALSSGPPPMMRHVTEEPEDMGRESTWVGQNESGRSDTVTEGTITPRPLTAASTITRKQSTDNLKRKPSLSSQKDSNDGIPPVPPLPANLRSSTAASSYSNLAPDRTASMLSRKAHSMRSNGSLRDRGDRPRTSGSMTRREKSRYSTSSRTNHHQTWNARDLLDDIDAEAPGALGSTGSRGLLGNGGVAKPPY